MRWQSIVVSDMEVNYLGDILVIDVPGFLVQLEEKSSAVSAKLIKQQEAKKVGGPGRQ